MADLAPENALEVLAERLRGEDSVISPHVRDTEAVPTFGLLVAAGPRATAAPGEYALIVESIREGYLLHYRDPRVVVGADRDLALLAGDYLYARGLERLAALQDLEAVRELSDLISLAAQVHAQGDGNTVGDALWLAAVVAVAAGGGDDHRFAKAAVRDDGGDPRAALIAAARSRASATGIADALTIATDSIGLASPDVPDDLG